MKKYKNIIKISTSVIIISIILALIYSIGVVYNNGNRFQLFDFVPTYGLKAYIEAFSVYISFLLVGLWPVYVILFLLIIISLIKTHKIKKENNNE